MGGMGSGRRFHYGANYTTNDYDAIDLRHWKRDGLLVAGYVFGWRWCRDGREITSIKVSVEEAHVNLAYRYRNGHGEWEDARYPVRLGWSICNLGGRRPWFLCPARGCGRRVAILYGGDIFACRRCYRLSYPSQRETSDDRVIRRADRLREKLGWTRGILNTNGSKPKGMHWRTFERVSAEHDLFVKAALLGASGFNKYQT